MNRYNPNSGRKEADPWQEERVAALPKGLNIIVGGIPEQWIDDRSTAWETDDSKVIALAQECGAYDALALDSGIPRGVNVSLVEHGGLHYVFGRWYGQPEAHNNGWAYQVSTKAETAQATFEFIKSLEDKEGAA